MCQTRAAMNYRTWHAVEQLRTEVVDVDAVVLQTLAEVLLPHADAAAALDACGATDQGSRCVRLQG